jgi:hypothetical protein
MTDDRRELSVCLTEVDFSLALTQASRAKAAWSVGGAVELRDRNRIAGGAFEFELGDPE